ncbi:MAG TPA: hypothetical protein VHZ78_01930 [Rhizomicrobium sp.]|nr:hypothetical protein [Rhizomicrobium sp.]
MTIFTLFGFMLAPFVVIALTLGVFCVFWAVLAVPFRFAFGQNWSIAATAGATACVAAAAVALIAAPEKMALLYHAARGLFGVA